MPVLNKIDLPAAEPDRIKQQIEDVIGLDASEAVPISAKTGLNIDLVLEAIVARLPPPKGDEDAPLKALLVDSWYDAYLGVVVLVRVIDGVLRKGMRIRMMGADAHYEIDRIGIFRPKMTEARELGPGEIGYITAQIKQVADTRVGDTITDDKHPTATARHGELCVTLYLHHQLLARCYYWLGVSLPNALHFFIALHLLHHALDRRLAELDTPLSFIFWSFRRPPTLLLEEQGAPG